LYRLAEVESLGYPDLVQVVRLIPKGVVCLISALIFHDLTSQIPHRVYIALPRSSQRPHMAYPPLAVFWLPQAANVSILMGYARIDRVAEKMVPYLEALL
jgi:hypothetical protein